MQNLVYYFILYNLHNKLGKRISYNLYRIWSFQQEMSPNIGALFPYFLQGEQVIVAVVWYIYSVHADANGGLSGRKRWRSMKKIVKLCEYFPFKQLFKCHSHFQNNYFINIRSIFYSIFFQKPCASKTYIFACNICTKIRGLLYWTRYNMVYLLKIIYVTGKFLFAN